MKTHEIIDLYFTAQELLELDPEDQTGKNMLEQAEQEARNKADKIHDFILDVESNVARSKAEVDVYQSEVDRLKKTVKRYEKLHTFLTKDLLCLFIDNLGDGKKWSNGIRTYTKVTRPGSLIILAQEKLDDWMVTKQETVLNRAGLRKAIISGQEVEGAMVEQSVSVRRS